jgi:hypothetical protein
MTDSDVAVSSKMEREDYLIILGGISIAILGGILRHMYILDGGAIYVLTLVVILTAPISIYSGKKVWGGEMAKNMELVAIGLGCVIINRIPQVVYQLNALDVFGLSIRFWAGFFNFLGAVGFAIVSYGFYKFWKVAQVDV